MTPRRIPTPTTTADVLAGTVELSGRRVVDVGSGAGALVRWLRGQGALVTGVECGEVMRARAIEDDPDHPDAHVDGVAQDLPFADGSVDVVVLSNSLHHVPVADMDAALAEARRVLRPGGTLFVAEPVAEGPLFEAVRPIDDETEVRARAQEALAAAAIQGDLELVDEITYTSVATFPDVETWERTVVGIDPARASAVDAHRDDIHRRFHDLGRHGDAGWSFTQPNHAHVFRRS